ncbi:hypothetical protein L0244_40715, partial [bacterium]|nr:hypothetical protein [bacterium]
MSVTLDYTINLESRSVRDFLVSSEPQYDEPVDDNFWRTEGFERKGNFVPIQDGVPLQPYSKQVQMFTAIRRTYLIIKNSAVINSISVILPVTHTLELNLFSVLFVRSALSDAEKNSIENAFIAFPPGQDPLQYVRQQEDNGINPDNYHVAITFRLKRVAETTDDKQDRWLKDAIAGRGGHTFLGESADVFMRNKGYELKPLRDEPLNDVPEHVPSKYEFDVPNVDDPAAARFAVSNVLTEEVIPELDCDVDVNDPLNKKIATLLAFPEFKVEWKPVSIRIGRCLRIIILWPFLRTRDAELGLYGYVGF